MCGGRPSSRPYSYAIQRASGCAVIAIRYRMTAADARDFNDFDSPEKVTLKPFTKAKISKGKLDAELPPMSIVTLTIE